MSDAVSNWENSHVEVYSDELVVLGNAMQAELVARIAELEARVKALHERRLPCREAEIAQKRYEDAEAMASSADALLLEATQWAKDARERAEQAEATIERLKVCGNCGRWGLLGLELESASVCRHMLTDASCYCRFYPSRWTHRSEA